jgi:phage-related baseplate assembly protein
MTFSGERIPPKPVFVDIDPAKTHIELVENFSLLLGKTIYPAQYEYLIADFSTYLYTIAQTSFQYTGEQSLVNYANGANLEQLGELLGVARLGAAASLVTLSFYIDATQTVDIFIPKNTRVRTSDRKVTFETLQDVFIRGTAADAPVRNTSVLVQARSQQLGEEGNRYAAGTINAIIDAPASPIQVKVLSTTISSGGIGEETDERLRSRIKLAPAAFSVAGSVEAYKYFALSSSPFIQDIGIVAPDPGGVIAALQALITEVSTAVQATALLATAKTSASATAAANVAKVQATVAPLARVKVYVLTQTGLPTPEIRALVASALNAERVRPLTDLVDVLDPIPFDYSVNIRLTLFNYAVADAAIAQARAEVKKITDSWASRLGADIVPEQLTSAIVPISSQQGGVYGVYRAEILSPSVQALDITQWARLTAEPTITVVAVTGG